MIPTAFAALYSLRLATPIPGAAAKRGVGEPPEGAEVYALRLATLFREPAAKRSRFLHGALRLSFGEPAAKRDTFLQSHIGCRVI